MLKIQRNLPIGRIGSTLGGILLFVILGAVLFKFKVNIYLALLLAWLVVALLPAVIRPKGKVVEGVQKLLGDKARARAFARTAALVGLFSLLANDSLRYYFWGISAINLMFAGIIAIRLYRSPQPQN